MKIYSKAVLCKDLKPGDLFSTAHQAYWDLMDTTQAIGEKIYIRTNVPCPQDQAEHEIQRITIHL